MSSHTVHETDDYRERTALIPGRVYLDLMRLDFNDAYYKQLWRLKFLTEIFLQQQWKAVESPEYPDYDLSFVKEVQELNYHDRVMNITFSPNQYALFAIDEIQPGIGNESLKAVYDYEVPLQIEWSAEYDELFDLTFAFKIATTRSTRVTNLLALYADSVPNKAYPTYLKELLNEYPMILNERSSIIQSWIEEQKEGRWSMSQATLAMYVILQHADLYSNERGIKGGIVELIHKLNGANKDNIRKELADRMLNQRDKDKNLDTIKTVLNKLDNEDIKTMLNGLY